MNPMRNSATTVAHASGDDADDSRMSAFKPSSQAQYSPAAAARSSQLAATARRREPFVEAKIKEGGFSPPPAPITAIRGPQPKKINASPIPVIQGPSAAETPVKMPRSMGVEYPPVGIVGENDGSMGRGADPSSVGRKTMAPAPARSQATLSREWVEKYR